MSVIAIKFYKDSVTMSCDSIIMCNESLSGDDKTFNFCKMFTKNDITFGCAGSIEEIVAFNIFLDTVDFDFEYNLKNFTYRLWDFKKWYFEKSGNESENDILIASPNGVLWFTGSSGIDLIDDFAIGVASDFALGAMKFGASSEEACIVATKLSNQCKEPITTKEIFLKKFKKSQKI